MEAGDIIFIPAGVGHKCLSASGNFLCAGGYPQGKSYDILHGEASELAEALQHIRQVSLPDNDPVYDKEGFLGYYWK